MIYGAVPPPPCPYNETPKFLLTLTVFATFLARIPGPTGGNEFSSHLLQVHSPLLQTRSTPGNDYFRRTELPGLRSRSRDMISITVAESPGIYICCALLEKRPGVYNLPPVSDYALAIRLPVRRSCPSCSGPSFLTRDFGNPTFLQLDFLEIIRVPISDVISARVFDPLFTVCLALTLPKPLPRTPPFKDSSSLLSLIFLCQAESIALY